MDFERVLALLDGFFSRAGRPYAVIGALGMAALGVGRTTFDVDIVAQADCQNDLIDFLEAEGYRTTHRSTGYSNHLNEKADLGRLDVVYVRGETAQKVFMGVTVRPGPGATPVPVPRPEHLAAMKVFATKNNPRRVLQDLEDIGRILKIPGVNRQEVLAYFSKYGLEELIDRLEP